jgi:hypothetical protein
MSKIASSGAGRNCEDGTSNNVGKDYRSRYRVLQYDDCGVPNHC